MWDEDDEDWFEDEYAEDSGDWGGYADPNVYENHGLKEMIPGLPNQLVMAVGLVCDDVTIVDMNAFLVVISCMGNLNFMRDNALYQLVDADGSVREEVRQSVQYWHDVRVKKESAAG